MLEIIKSTNIEDIKDIRKRYKDNLVLVNNYTDDWNGNRKGSVYAVSHDESSYEDILELYSNIKSMGKCIVIGEYDEGALTHVQFRNR